MCAEHSSLSSFQLVLSLALGKLRVLVIFSSILWGTLQISVHLSPLVFCHANSCCSGLPGLLLHLLRSRNAPGSVRSPSLPCSLGHSGAHHLICFCLLGTTVSLLPDVQYLENHCFRCYVWLFCGFGWEPIPGSILARSRKLNLYFSPQRDRSHLKWRRERRSTDRPYSVLVT